MTVGVLVMAYGGPDTLDDVAPYLLDVRGGRETPPAMVEEIRARYAQIGGRSPILERTRAPAAALDASLNRSGARWAVAVGMRHWRPYIKDTLADFAARGVRRVVGPCPRIPGPEVPLGRMAPTQNVHCQGRV